MRETAPNTAMPAPIERAVIAIRQKKGIIVTVGGSYGVAIIQAAEGLDEDSVARAWSLAASPPRLALTARRLEALGRACEGGPEAVALPLHRSMLIAFINGLVDARAPFDIPTHLLTNVLQADGNEVDEIAVKLMKLAGLLPAALIAPIEPQEQAIIAQRNSLEQFQLNLQDLVSHEERLASTLTLVARARVPLADAEEAWLLTFRPGTGGVEHLAVVVGQPDLAAPVLTRLHSSCLTGDFLGSLRCDCGDQLRGAVKAMTSAGGGVLLYLSQEGRGIGLVNKLRAYALQDQGLDTVDANEHLGFEADERDFRVAAEMLGQLGIKVVDLMTNNPAKIAALQSYGIAVANRISHAFVANKHNASYLRTKAVRNGHYFHEAAAWPALAEVNADLRNSCESGR